MFIAMGRTILCKNLVKNDCRLVPTILLVFGSSYINLAKPLYIHNYFMIYLDTLKSFQLTRIVLNINNYAQS